MWSYYYFLDSYIIIVLTKLIYFNAVKYWLFHCIGKILKIKYVSISVCVHSVLVKKRSSIDMNLLMSYLGRRGQDISFQMICLVHMYNFNRLHMILRNFQSSKNKCFHKRFLIQINYAFKTSFELINQLIILSNHYKI